MGIQIFRGLDCHESDVFLVEISLLCSPLHLALYKFLGFIVRAGQLLSCLYVATVLPPYMVGIFV